MRFFVFLLFLPSVVFASSIGTYSVGFKIGQTNVGMEIDGLKGEWDGLGVELNGNFNITSKDKYGFDILILSLIHI